jgi:RND family efflux transporter MFP subunit
MMRWLPAIAGAAAVAVLFLPNFASLRSTGNGAGPPSPEPAQFARVDAPLEATPLSGSPTIAAEAPDLGDDSDETVLEFEASAFEAEESFAGDDGAPALDENPLDCVIEPNDVVEIGSPVTGLIETIHVERGDTVEVGQILVELESGVEKAAVELARVRAGMQSDVKSRAARLSLDERRQGRAGELFERDALSLDEVDQLETEAELARLELRKARENRELAKLELHQAIEALERRIIHSPISGVVVERKMSPGEVVDEETILTVAQIDPLRVEVILPSMMFGSIQPGMRAAVVPEHAADRVQVASVVIVDRVIDAASGTFGVRLELPNPDFAIPGGLHCQVRFATDQVAQP